MAPRILAAFLAAALAVASPAWAQENRARSRAELPEPSFREDACGWVFAVESYHADIAGLSISLTANDRLLVNGRLLAEDDPFERSGPRPWHDSANTAHVARARNLILVKTNATDCIDGSATRIYVLDAQGALVASSGQWSEHDRDGFFIELNTEALVYWSEHFCRNRQGADVKVYVLRQGARQFVEETRPWEGICSERPEARLGGDLYFAPMRPQSPRSARAQ